MTDQIRITGRRAIVPEPRPRAMRTAGTWTRALGVLGAGSLLALQAYPLALGAGIVAAAGEFARRSHDGRLGEIAHAKLNVATWFAPVEMLCDAIRHWDGKVGPERAAIVEAVQRYLAPTREDYPEVVDAFIHDVLDLVLEQSDLVERVGFGELADFATRHARRHDWLVSRVNEELTRMDPHRTLPA